MLIILLLEQAVKKWWRKCDDFFSVFLEREIYIKGIIQKSL